MNIIFRNTKGLVGVTAISMAMLICSPVRSATASSRPANANVISSDAVIIVNGEVPFKARLSGSAAFTSPTTVDFHGTGQATHLGRFAASGVAVLGESTGTCPGDIPNVPNVHTETLTAANGDELVIRMVNVGCPTGPYSFHGTGNWTVLSGTGRFQDVTGQGTNEGNADFESNTFELALTGSLVRP